MKTLLLLRHAKSQRHTDGPDHDRPLNDRGREDAPRMGILLRERELIPDLIISSTARRARETAEAVAESCEYRGSPELRDELYMAGPDAFYEVLHHVADQAARVLVVAHNPGLEEFLEELTRSFEELPTAALAHIALPVDSWRELDATTRGRLEHLWRPREM